MCGGQFNLLGLQNIWQCFNCAYEEPAADNVQVTREEKKSEPVDAPPSAQDLWPDPDHHTAPEQTPEPEPALHKPASFVEPLASMVEQYQPPPKVSPRSQPIKKKPCPACKKKMFWFPEENAWRCPDCNYERRSLS
jgi:ribosomal protein L37AE/L43A